MAPMGKTIVTAFASQVAGRTFLITGPSVGGIGAETAISLAHGRPRRVLLAGRSESKILPVVEQIRSLSPSTTATFIPLDLASQASIRSAASQIRQVLDSDANEDNGIDVLINNAAVMCPPEMLRTKEGIELQFGVNHIGHFLLTNLLWDKLVGKDGPSPGGIDGVNGSAKHEKKENGAERKVGPRIINVTSHVFRAQPIRFDDYNFGAGENYNPWLGYAQSKTANVLFSVALARRLRGEEGACSFAVHPGVVSTNLARMATREMFMDVMSMFNDRRQELGNDQDSDKSKSLQEACATTLTAALDPKLDADSGIYLRECRIYDAVQPPPSFATDTGEAEKLWKLSEKLVGQTFDFVVPGEKMS